MKKILIPNQKKVGRYYRNVFILFGIGLSLEEGYLAVCNGLDENKISIFNDINQEYKYTYV